MKIVVCVSGASGTIYAVRLLQILNLLKPRFKLEPYLIVSKMAALNIKVETDYSLDDVITMCNQYFHYRDLSASISSGSFFFDAVMIVPCSMRTLAGVAHGYEDNLITRVASVAIKEKRKLILAIRETPLSSIHLKNMLELSYISNISITPLVPSFYNRPNSIEELVDYSIYRILDLIGIRAEHIKRWS